MMPPLDISPRVVLETINQRQVNNNHRHLDVTMTSSINVVLAIDGKYIAHAAPAMLSMLDMINRAAAIRFFLLTDQTLSEQDRAILSAIFTDCDIRFIDMDNNAFTWAPLNRSHVSVASYYRLNMHRLLPADVERVIYIDADTIVVDSLVKLWNIDIGSKPIAACADGGGVTQSNRMSLPSSHSYFNAGVMIFNLAELRKSNELDGAFDLYRMRKKDIIFQDQDILNIMFCNRTYILPLKWNINHYIFAYSSILPSYSVEDAREAVMDPGIIHFTERIKPWDAHSRCVNPFARLYWHYRNMTPWKESPAQQITRNIRERVRARFSATQRRQNKWYRQVDAGYTAGGGSQSSRTL
jgi:lipopolysaccharide biosynthesis glycosyltransferase